MLGKSIFNSQNKVWCGPKVSSVYNPNQNIGRLILSCLKNKPDLITQISEDTGAFITCKEMYNRTMKIAKYLQKSELEIGTRIGFVAANSENLAPIVFACFLLGLPINPLAPIMKEKDIEQMFSKIQPKIIFCDAATLKVVQNAVNEMNNDTKILTVMERVTGYDCVTDILKDVKMEQVENFEFPSVDPDSTAAILCSSGSTGFPKGICKSHRQIITHFYPFWKQSNSTEIFFQSSSIFWLSGFYALITSVLFGCTRICTVKPLDPEILYKTVQKYNVTILMIPPYVLLSLLQLEDLDEFPSLKYVFVGGAPVSKSLVVATKSYIPNGDICLAYGCTEQDFYAINTTGRKYDSTGFLLQNVELKIVDDQNNPLGVNQKGEIWCKIQPSFIEYFGDPEKTAEAYDGDWFKTGDIGYFDDEGYLYVIDRKKELLKYKNYQVTPSEIEEVINEIEGVIGSCVVGVPELDTGNDIIYAFVIVSKKSGLTEEFVLEYVNEKVIDPKRIRGAVRFVNSIPVGLTGKVDRKKVRKMAINLWSH